jgi:Ser/Thr protein kinase RdoA (MazF antagonist)
MHVFPVTHSTLSQNALLSKVVPLYLGKAAGNCRLLVRGMNDTYLVQTLQEQYLLRAYRHGWRTLSDIQHELELLQYLHRRGVRVAAPLARTDSDLVTPVHAPEGTRYLALFSFAPGLLRPLSPETASSYGRAAATLHREMASFESDHYRYSLDLQHLLDDRVPLILPLLEHRPDDQAFVERLGRFLGNQIQALAPRLTCGLCHGDLNGGNCHMDDQGRLTFFDFDCEGPGWLAYDVAVFNWSVRGMPDQAYARRLWEVYLASYLQENPLSDHDMAAIPFFVAARQLWLVGMHCRHADEWTYGNLSEAYFDRRIELLREVAREQRWVV